jgi:hypothetical protein
MSNKPAPSLVNLLGLGVKTALCVAAGIGVGYWLDKTLRTGLLLTFIGLAIGLAGAVALVYLEIKSFL